MLRGTIEKIGGGRVPFERIDHGEMRPHTFASSFRIDGGPFVESWTDTKDVVDDIAASCALRVRKDNEAIRKAGGNPDTIEFD